MKINPILSKSNLTSISASFFFLLSTHHFFSCWKGTASFKKEDDFLLLSISSMTSLCRKLWISHLQVCKYFPHLHDIFSGPQDVGVPVHCLWPKTNYYVVTITQICGKSVTLTTRPCCAASVWRIGLIISYRLPCCAALHLLFDSVCLFYGCSAGVYSLT